MADNINELCEGDFYDYKQWINARPIFTYDERDNQISKTYSSYRKITWKFTHFGDRFEIEQNGKIILTIKRIEK